MQSYYGGRAEIRIRHTPVPVVYTDFLSQYPTVNTLMKLWKFLIADKLRIEDATSEVNELLQNQTLKQAFDPQFWVRLPFFALVEPTDDIFPIRTNYAGDNSNIGVNPLRLEKTIWYAGPDIVAATLQTRKVPKVLQAFKVIAEGVQAGLKSVALRGAVSIDPIVDDFFRKAVEARAEAKENPDLSNKERKALRDSLKDWVNIYDGKIFRLGRPGLRLPYELKAKTYGDVIRDYQKHPEAKSLAPDGSVCSSVTAGLLRRTPVTAADEFAFIGKETDRRLEREDDISLIESRVTQYRRDETQLLVADPRLSHKARQTSIRKL